MTDLLRQAMSVVEVSTETLSLCLTCNTVTLKSQRPSDRIDIITLQVLFVVEGLRV